MVMPTYVTSGTPTALAHQGQLQDIIGMPPTDKVANGYIYGDSGQHVGTMPTEVVINTAGGSNGRLYNLQADLQVRTLTPDNAGSNAQTWTTTRRRIPCALDFVAGDRQILDRLDQFFATHTLFMDPLTLTKESHRFIVDGITYAIKNSWNMRGHHMEIDVLECEDAA